MHSYEAYHPKKQLAHDGSREVKILMILFELFLKKCNQNQKTKSDIFGWQHLRLPNYLLDTTQIYEKTRIMRAELDKT